MKLKSKIVMMNGKLAIELSKTIVKNGGLSAGDSIEIELSGSSMTITNMLDREVSFMEDSHKNSLDIFSRTLSEEELILAK